MCEPWIPPPMINQSSDMYEIHHVVGCPGEFPQGIPRESSRAMSVFESSGDLLANDN